MKHGWTHMTLFQGKNSEILFKGWPGRNDGGMYALALIVVFILAALLEWVNSWGFNYRLNKFVEVAIHAFQVGLSGILMLALMSFNIGVVIVTVAGRALAFFFFNSAFGRKNDSDNTMKPNPSDCECC